MKSAPFCTAGADCGLSAVPLNPLANVGDAGGGVSSGEGTTVWSGSGVEG